MTARRAVLAAFGLVLLAACATRFWRLGDVGLWYDELWSVVGASERPLGEVYREWMKGDPHPPGYFLFFFAWFKVFPNDEWWARLPSALAGVATVAYLLFGTRRTLSVDERVMSAGFVATSHAFVLYALTAKQYAAMLLWATIATVTSLELAEAKRFDDSHRKTSALFFGSLAALAWLNYLATVYAALAWLLVLWNVRRDAAQLKLGLRWTALTALVCFPLLWFQYLMVRFTPGDWQKDSFAELAKDLVPHLFFADAGWLVLGLLAAVVLALASRREARQALWTARNGRLLALLGGMLGFLLLAGVFKPLFFIRYFLIAFPALLLVLGLVVAAAFPLERWWLALIPLLFLSRAAVVEFRHADTLMRQHWDQSVDLVLGAAKPDDVVLVLGASQQKTMFEYLQAQDEWSLYYVRNLSFYRYYFRRRGADAVAQKLEVMGVTVDAARALCGAWQGSGRTVWILGGHHIKLNDDAVAELQGRAASFELTQLFSTRVYRVTF